MKSTFVKFLSPAHINRLNLALYSSGAVRLEHAVFGCSFAARKFDSPESAQDWFDGLPGERRVDRLANAIDLMTGSDNG